MFTLKKTGSSGSQAKRWGSQQQESNKVEKKKIKQQGWMGGTEEKTNEGAKDKPLTLLILVLVMNISTEYKDY